MKSVFQKFGGIRPMASKIGVPPSTVKSWHKDGKIPSWRHASILDSALRHNVQITPDEISAIRPDEVMQDAAA